MLIILMWGKFEGVLDFGVVMGFFFEEGLRGSRYLGVWFKVVLVYNMMLIDGRMMLVSGLGILFVQLMLKVVESGVIVVVS